jgi:uncharacterized protein (TIGR02453 family)
MTVVVSPGERFAGFPEEGVQFLLELQAEQSRAWFKAHQADFIRLCRRPLELFVYELRERLLDVYPGLKEVEPHFFRIQRDTRFSRDKDPYKTNVSAYIPVRPTPASVDPGHAMPGLYVSFGLEEDEIAVGSWHLSPEVLGRYRGALDHPDLGPEIQTIVDRLQADGFQVTSMEALKRVPPPYPQDHPRADLLKRKGLAAYSVPPEGLTASPDLLDWAEERLRRAAPLAHWLETALAER